MSKYQAYPEYKDSGVEWLGEIPAHWLTSKLRYTFSFGKGLTITKENLRDIGIPCVSYGEVHSKYGFEIDPARHPLKCVSDEYIKTSPYALLKKGDIVFADTSEDIDGSGNFTQLVSNEQVFAGYHTIIARPYNRDCSRFYAYLLDSKELRTQIRHAVKGVKVFSITQAILRGVNIWLPSLEERNQIANFLDHETAKIDTLIEKQQQLIKLLKEKRQAVISHAVTKGLNPQAPMKDSGVEWLGEVPEHWIVLALRRVVQSMEQGKSPECESTPAPDGQWGVLKTSCVNNGIFHAGENKALPSSTQPHKKYEVKAGDVLMSRASGSIKLIGSVAIAQAGVRDKLLLSDKVFRLHLSPKLMSEYFSYMMATPYMRTLVERAISGAEGMANNITKSSIMEFVGILPPLEEQAEIVEHISNQCERFDEIISKALKGSSLLQERRTALISAAVTGKIDVRNWQVPTSQNQALKQTA